jgi:hypothetical protein
VRSKAPMLAKLAERLLFALADRGVALLERRPSSAPAPERVGLPWLDQKIQNDASHVPPEHKVGYHAHVKIDLEAIELARTAPDDLTLLSAWLVDLDVRMRAGTLKSETGALAAYMVGLRHGGKLAEAGVQKALDKRQPVTLGIPNLSRKK